jgi:hypothetical protein
MDRHFHYRKAEECAEWAHQLLLTEEGSQDAAVWAAIAQAHATLARTATEAPANTTWPKPPAETRRRVIPTPTEIELGEAKNPPPPRRGTGHRSILAASRITPANQVLIPPDDQRQPARQPLPPCRHSAVT